MWTSIGFGKHRSRTLPHVILTDPEWFYWSYHADVFGGQVLAEARLLYEYARTIKAGLAKGSCYEYRVGASVEVALVRVGGQPARKDELTIRCDVLDLEFPRKRDDYVQKDYHRFMECVEMILFGKVTKPYVKREVCERFFSTPGNFRYQAKTARRRGR